MERIAEQDIAAVDTRLPKQQLSDFLETSGKPWNYGKRKHLTIYRRQVLRVRTAGC